MILAYRLRIVSDSDLQLTCFALDIRKGSKWAGTAYHLNPESLIKGKKGNVRVRVLPLDRKILMSMMMNQKTGSSEAVFRGINTSRIMEHLLSSGRAYLHGKNNRPLQSEARVTAELSWEHLDEQLKPTIALPAHCDLIPGNPCFSVDRDTGACREVEIKGGGNAAWSWIASPPVSPEECPSFLEKQATRYPGAEFPAPPTLEVQVLTDVHPTPVVTYCTEDRITRLPMRLELQVRYQSRNVPVGSEGNLVRWIEGHTVYETHRDPEFEQATLDRFTSYGFVAYRPQEGNLFAPRLESPCYICAESSQGAWASCLSTMVLENPDWEWDLPPAYQPRVIADQDWFLNFEEEKTGTLKYTQGVVVDGVQLNLLPVLQSLLSARAGLTLEEILNTLTGDTTPLPSEQGLLLISTERLHRMLNTLFELQAPGSLDAKGRIRVGAYRAAELFEDTATGWTPAPELVQQVEALQGGHEVEPLDPPESFQGELREYQREGLGWLSFLCRTHLGGILADDMGLGKTVQILSLLLQQKAEHPTDFKALVICPTSVLPNWHQELKRFAPDLRCLRHHGADRKRKETSLQPFDVILTTYGTVLRDEDLLNACSYHLLILDEAQAIKNPKAKITKAVKRLNGTHRIALSGTPLENHLGELRSLVDVVMPGYPGTEREFNTVLRRPIEDFQDRRAYGILQKRMAPILLRRTKDQVAQDLPPKTEIRQELELTEVQADAYEVVRAAGEEALQDTFEEQGFERSRIHVLDLLLKLRQVCCDPRLLPGETGLNPAESAKTNWLREVLPELIEEGRRILLFSQFTSMMDLLKPELKQLKIPFVELRGTTRDRETPVKQFQSGEVPLFLISLKAGGTGLNLTAADTVIFYDPWWNPAAEHQAADRAHRIGQDKPVFVYKLVCKGTIEDRILELQEKKKELSDLLSNETSSSLQLSEQDLQALLAPLGP